MFDQIKLPVCPVCGDACIQALLYERWTLRFACGYECTVKRGEDHWRTRRCGRRIEVLARGIRKLCSKYEPGVDESVLTLERQRHAEVRADVAQRLKAAQDEQEKGYGTSV